FMQFKFDEGSYAFAGREQLLNREVYKVEYYPHHLFNDKKGAGGRGKGAAAETTETAETRARRQKQRDADEKIDAKMDKVSMVTLWIEPKDHQILQYEFTNIDFDFLPGRSLVRL